MRERSKIHTELIQSFKKGDRNAYAEIYRLFYPALFNYGKKICSDSSAVEDNKALRLLVPAVPRGNDEHDSWLLLVSHMYNTGSERRK